VDGEAEVSTNPTNFRFPFEPHIAKLEPQVQYVIRNLWNSVTDAQNAVPILKAQIDANKSAVASVTNTVTNNSTASETVVQSSSPTIGFVNDQSGNTSYATTQNDYGAYVIFDDASPVAVSLTGAPVIQLPWACVLINDGVGLVTVTPSSGTITYPNNLAAASMPIAQGQAAIVVYDGTNFYGVIIPVSPQTIASVTSNWLNSYNSITGIFTTTQPAFTDILGVAATDQIGTGTPLAGEYVDGGTGVWTALPGGGGGNTHSESLTDANANFIFAATLSKGGDIITVTGVQN
jgi:hypothetical protein